MVSQPEWEKELDTENLFRALRWMGNNLPDKEARKNLLLYLNSVNRKADGILLKKWSGNPISTDGWVSKLLLDGYILPEKSFFNFNKAVSEYINLAKMEKLEKKNKSKLIPLQVKPEYPFGELEYEIDLFLDKFKSDFSMAEWINKKNFSKSGIKACISFLQESHLIYYNEAIDDPKLLRESYGFTKTKMKKLVEFINSLIFDCNSILGLVSKVEPPKVKKKVDDVKSQDTNNINGAKEIWFLNSRTFEIGYYTQNDVNGLQLVGQNIENYNESKSLFRRDKKGHKKFVEDSKKSSSAQLRKQFNKLTSKIRTCGGRLNKHILIFKIV